MLCCLPTGFGHTGGIDGFRSVVAYFPAGEISFSYTSNGMNFNGNDISIAVLSAAYNKPFEVPEFKIYELTDEDLEKYLGVYSSTQLPLKDKFEFKQAGVVLEFNPTNKTMILKQGGGVFNLERE